MRKILISSTLVLLLAISLLLNFAPDTLAMLILAMMTIVTVWGYLFGMLPTVQYLNGFRIAKRNIMELRDVQASSPWIALQNVESVFHQRDMDRMFEEYRRKVNSQEQEGKLVSDIVEYVNEEGLALRSWQNVVQQIPGTLTALGLLGTFVGLIVGISGIGFSSVEAALSSIELLLSGIRTAFYTSIAGVILSILFNLMYRLMWNSMLREMGMFIEVFHQNVLPSMEEQERDRAMLDNQQILERLDRLPKAKGYSLSAGTGDDSDPFSEQRLMPEIREGLQNGEFIFYIQPKYELNSKQIIGGEALVRWEHHDMGLISPSYFMPVVERNGFIVRLDTYLWEQAFKTVRVWIDAGYRPVPISVNISKTDIMAMDLADWFSSMLRKYRIPPRYMELEFAENAYLECEAAAKEAETQLRQRGFRVIVDGFHGDLVELKMLKNTQADAVKIDLRYIKGKNNQNVDAIRDVVTKLKMMDMGVVVGSIESAEQASVLRSLGCSEGQGYYFSPVLPLSEYEKALGIER